MTATPAGTIHVEAPSRWDALELARRLSAYHTYLVQLGNRRWLVCVRADDALDDVFDPVRRTAERWARERHVDAVLRVGDRALDLAGR